ncbi:hypothetical protein D3C78_1767830 [compost metagenome]
MSSNSSVSSGLAIFGHNSNSSSRVKKAVTNTKASSSMRRSWPSSGAMICSR